MSPRGTYVVWQPVVRCTRARPCALKARLDGPMCAISMILADADDVTKKLFIKTYGCQMNVYDSDRMAHSLASHGYAVAAEPDDADLVILNTCHIREKAAEKVFSELGRLRRLRDARRDAHRARDGAGGRRLRRSGRGRAAGRAGAVRRHRCRSAGLSSPARDAGAPGAIDREPSSTPSFRPRASSTSCRQDRPARGCQRVPHHPGRLRQVLHLLRRALHARRGAEPAGRADILRRGAWPRRRPGRARSRCSARTSTRTTAPARTAGSGASPACCGPWPRSPGLRGCATRPRTRVTWTPT